MGKLSSKYILGIGSGLALAFILVAAFIYAFGPSVWSSDEAQSGGAGRQGLNSQEAARVVRGFSESVRSENGPTAAAPVQNERAALPQSNTSQSTTSRLSEAEEALLAAALEQQAREQERLRDRAQAASEAPLGESIHDVYAGIKQRRAQRLEGEFGQNDLSGLGQPQDAAAISVQPEPIASFDLATGTVIPARLMGDVRSELPGLVRAIVTNDVFDSLTMRRVIIPRGSQLVGSYGSETSAGQNRLFVYWTELRTPDGRTFDLGEMASVDATGASGIRGRRQTGFLTTLLQGVLIGTLQNSLSTGAEASDLATAARIATGQTASSMTDRYLESRLSQGPRFTVRAGTVVNVVLETPFSAETGLLRRRSDAGANALAPIPVVASASPDGDTPLAYDRAEYGVWADANGDCRNTRHEVLASLSTGPVQFTPDGCAVVRGRWLDPYSGNILREARDLDVDHLVPLAWAHERGAASWEGARKVAFGNDPRNLFATTAEINRAKGAQGPLDWLPPNAAFRCEYVTRFRRVVQFWELQPLPGEDGALASLQTDICA